MKEALKLALEALKKVYDNVSFYGEVREAIAAIEAVLAQPEQEPVAYFNPQVKGGFYWAKPTKITAPITVSVEPMPLYTTPPQRTWVGLTDEEAQWLYDNCRTPSNLIDMTEAKLKEKNNG